MPNHVTNHLEINGDEKTIAEIKKLLHGENGEIDFNKIFPYPERFLLQDKKAREFNEKKKPEEEYMKDGYNSGGYEWCVDNWGTKWNAYEIQFSDAPDCLVYDFQTAWSQPEPIVERLHEFFPTAEIDHRYISESYEWCGHEYYQGEDDPQKVGA